MGVQTRNSRSASSVGHDKRLHSTSAPCGRATCKQSVDTGIECNHFGVWFHPSCAHLSAATFIHLTSDNNIPWFCDVCRQTPIAKCFDGLFAKIKVLEHKNQVMESQIRTLLAENPVNHRPRSIEYRDQWTQVASNSAAVSRSSIKKPPVQVTQYNKTVAPSLRAASELAPGKVSANRHPIKQHFPAPSTSSCVAVVNATKLTRNEANLSVICSNVPESNSASLKERKTVMT